MMEHLPISHFGCTIRTIHSGDPVVYVPIVEHDGVVCRKYLQMRTVHHIVCHNASITLMARRSNYANVGGLVLLQNVYCQRHPAIADEFGVVIRSYQIISSS